MPAPVDPYPDFRNLIDIPDANQVNARFRRLYQALDKTKVGLDASSFKDGAFTAVKFSAQQAWQALTLTGATWAPTTLAYYKDQVGIVRVRSELFTSSGAALGLGTVLGTFPAGYRPGVTAWIKIWAVGAQNTPGEGSVEPDGTLRMQNQAGGLFGHTTWALYGWWRAEG